jgi:hypothetical protein
MANKITDVRQLGWFARFGNVAMIPLMYALSGTFREKPHKNQTWDVQRFTPIESARLDVDLMLPFEGVEGAVECHSRWSIGPFIPFLHGWRDYVVLRPSCEGEWHVGWVVTDERRETAISRIPLVGDVRMKLGPGRVSFFGINGHGVQIRIQGVGKGRTGDRGPFCKVQQM